MTYIYNSPVNFNIPKVPFRGSPTTFTPEITAPKQDGFATNPLYSNFGTKSDIEAKARSNPRLQELAQEYNLPLKANMQALEDLEKGHLRDTRILSAKMYSTLPNELKSQVNLKSLQDAAMLHDYGKVLIPDYILNKKGTLTPVEREIMELHPEIGYELQKDNKYLDEEALNLIKYHHQTPNGKGYPNMPNNQVYSLGNQILNIADKYSALKENRCYKSAMSTEDAIKIIKKEALTEGISPDVIEALEKAVV